MQSWDSILEKPYVRSIRTTLVLLEKGMREFERMLITPSQAGQGTLYALQLELTDSQIQTLLASFAEIRFIVSEMKTTLVLEPETEVMPQLLWGWCWSMLEPVTELLPRYFRGYGELPQEVSECMEKNVTRLSEILQEIAKTASKRAPMQGKKQLHTNDTRDNEI